MGPKQLDNPRTKYIDLKILHNSGNWYIKNTYK